MTNNNTPGNSFQLWIQTSKELEIARARIAELESELASHKHTIRSMSAEGLWGMQKVKPNA